MWIKRPHLLDERDTHRKKNSYTWVTRITVWFFFSFVNSRHTHHDVWCLTRIIQKTKTIFNLHNYGLGYFFPYLRNACVFWRYHMMLGMVVSPQKCINMQAFASVWHDDDDDDARGTEKWMYFWCIRGDHHRRGQLCVCVYAVLVHDAAHLAIVRSLPSLLLSLSLCRCCRCRRSNRWPALVLHAPMCGCVRYACVWGLFLIYVHPSLVPRPFDAFGSHRVRQSVRVCASVRMRYFFVYSSRDRPRVVKRFSNAFWFSAISMLRRKGSATKSQQQQQQQITT